MKVLDLWTDGGARGNPGPAAIGVVIRSGARVVESFGRTIGSTTNNRAEYAALLAGLAAARALGGTHLTCHLDSELVVAQLTGRYRVKDPGMRSAVDEVRAIEQGFSEVRYVTVPRTMNREADRLVNHALDSANAA